MLTDPGWPHDYGQYCECLACGGPAEPLLDGVAAHIPGTDYYDGRDGSIEADEDDEETIADQEAHREDWQDYLEWQRTSH